MNPAMAAKILRISIRLLSAGLSIYYIWKGYPTHDKRRNRF